MAYQVNEIFESIQGEGTQAGRLSTFIRLQGCPVGCRWCDSVRTWGPEAKTKSYWIGYIDNLSDVARLEVTLPLMDLVDHEVTDEHDRRRGRVAAWYDSAGKQFIDNFIGGEADRLVRLYLTEQGFETQNDGRYLMVKGAQLFMDYYQPISARRQDIYKSHVNGTKMEAVDIATAIKTVHVIITGGEPIIWNLDPLIEAIERNGARHTIQIETSGLNNFKGKRVPNFVTWSPKENLKWNAPEDFKFWVNEVKWVVDDALKPDTVLQTHEWFLRPGNCREMPRFVLMPEGSPPSPESIARATDMLKMAPPSYEWNWLFGGRLQYWLGVR